MKRRTRIYYLPLVFIDYHQVLRTHPVILYYDVNPHGNGGQS